MLTSIGYSVATEPSGLYQNSSINFWLNNKILLKTQTKLFAYHLAKYAMMNNELYSSNLLQGLFVGIS